MNRIKIEQGRQDLNSVGGLSLVSSQLTKCHYPRSYYTDREDTIGKADYLNAYLGILCLGKTEYEAIEPYRKSRIFKNCLHLKKVPSSSALRQNLNALSASESTYSTLRKISQTLLKPATFSTVQGELGCYIPLDIDVTPLDNSGSKKEGVSCTYKLYDGYAPIISYLGAQGYAVHGELREGKQHCQNGMPDFLRETLERSLELIPKDQEVLVRLDGGHDSSENYHILTETERCRAIVKRNLRKEKKEEWLERAKALGTLISDDGMKQHYRGFLTNFTTTYEDKETLADVVFDVTYEYMDRNGQFLMIPHITVETYWTNLPESPDTIIELYHDHATSEQFHSEIKTDMDVERLPSSFFSSNKLVFQLALIAYNMLRRISIDIIPYNCEKIKKRKVKRRRIRTVLLDIIYTGCQWIEKAGRKILRLGKNCSSYKGIQALYLAYL